MLEAGLWIELCQIERDEVIHGCLQRRNHTVFGLAGGGVKPILLDVYYDGLNAKRGANVDVMYAERIMQEYRHCFTNFRFCAELANFSLSRYFPEYPVTISADA